MRHPRHSGPRPRADRQRRPPSDQVACVLSGALRFVDDGSRFAAMTVREATSAGRRLVGMTVTIDLGRARLTAPDRNEDGTISLKDLLPGDRVRVTARVPRSPEKAPPVIAVRRMSAYAPAAVT
jgi:hypothetical protein